MNSSKIIIPLIWKIYSFVLYPIRCGMWFPLMWQINFISQKQQIWRIISQNKIHGRKSFWNQLFYFLICRKSFLFCWSYIKSGLLTAYVVFEDIVYGRPRKEIINSTRDPRDKNRESISDFVHRTERRENLFSV